VNKANQAGVRLTAKQILLHQTIAELAKASSTLSSVRDTQASVTGSVNLLPDQHFLLQLDVPDRSHMHVRMLFDVQQPCDAAWWNLAINEILRHHDALRSRFINESGSWKQFILANEDNTVFSHIDLSQLSQDHQNQAFQDKVREFQENINLSKGPLIYFAYFDMGKLKPGLLLIIVHHLVFDAASGGILIGDLEIAWQQLRRGDAIQLPPRTTSVRDWAERLLEYRQSPELLEELSFWTDKRWAKVPILPVDFAESSHKNNVRSEEILLFSLNETATQEFLTIRKNYNVQAIEILLAALSLALAEWTKERKFLVRLMTHGRVPLFEDMDLSRTIGVFATPYPVLLDITETDAKIDVLFAVKDQLNAVPNGGFGFGVLRYLAENSDLINQFENLPQPEIFLNYFGTSSLDSNLFKNSDISIESLPWSPDAKRPHLIELWIYFVGDNLVIEIGYSKNCYKRTTIEFLAQTFIQSIESLANSGLISQALDQEG
jgi:non-ribosomal peptide synthase protein (TIGR01720 family)